MTGLHRYLERVSDFSPVLVIAVFGWFAKLTFRPDWDGGFFYLGKRHEARVFKNQFTVLWYLYFTFASCLMPHA